MQGLNEVYLKIAIQAMLQANRDLGKLSCREALEPANFGKADTLILDAVPEIAIKKVLTDFFAQKYILITEESGKSSEIVDTNNKIIIFVDPVEG